MAVCYKSVLAGGGGGGTGLHVDSLTITSQPTIKTYMQGEVIDTTGMVVTASASGMSGTVTQYCTVSPQILDTAGTQTMTVSYGDATATFNVTVEEIVSLSITSQPTKTAYIQGETLDLTGIAVTATSATLTKNVTNICSYVPANGSTLSTTGTITITASLSGLSDTTTVTSYAITEIEITTPPTKTTYKPNERLNLAGIVVSATAGILTKDVTADCTFNPTNGTVLTTLGSFTLTATYQSFTDSISFEVVNSAIYGVQWDGSSSTSWTRTDDSANFANPNPYYANMSTTPSSPFDNLMPWSGMQIVEDTDAGKLVSIPKFWYKWTRNGSTMKLQISDSELTGFLVSPAHADRGDGKGERDYVYVGAYHCATSTYKSTSGVKPATNYTRAQFRTNIHNLGSTYWQWDFAMLWTLRMLYLVEFADWNSQNKIGYGCGDNYNMQVMGYTNSMPYHTGTTRSNRTTYGAGIKYRYIEGLWDNAYDFIDGIYFSDRTIYAIKNPANFSDTTGGTNVGTRANANGVVTEWTEPSASGFEYALYPAAVTTDNNCETYDCDSSGYVASGVVLYGGGGYYQEQSVGAFYMSSGEASKKSASISSRLMKLP